MYKTCAKRALPCNLGCGLILRAEQWAAEGVRKRHNTVECPKRRVECPRDCGQAVVFDEMDEHLEVLCPKRPVPPLPCRLGCGVVFKGGWDQLLQLEEDRDEHEREICPERMVRCDYEDCMARLVSPFRNTIFFARRETCCILLRCCVAHTCVAACRGC